MTKGLNTNLAQISTPMLCDMIKFLLTEEYTNEVKITLQELIDEKYKRLKIMQYETI